MNYKDYISYHNQGDAGVEERMIASLCKHYKLSGWDSFRLIYFYTMTYHIPSALDMLLENEREIKRLHFRTDRRYVRCNGAFPRLLKELTRDKYERLKNVESTQQAGDIVRLGGMTDCFQPLERKERITYKTIEELNKQRVGYLIVTKSDIVADDDYIALMDKELSHIQITITCTDDEYSRQYEKAVPPSKRIAAVEKLQAAGFDVQVRLSPFIPEFIEKGVLDMDKLNAIKCDKILVEFLRVNTWIKRWFDISYRNYTLQHAGYRHLPLYLKQRYMKLIRGFKEISICEDVDKHYRFFIRNYIHNPNDCCNLRK